MPNSLHSLTTDIDAGMRQADAPPAAVISAIVPITERCEDLSAVLSEYMDALDDLGLDFELICAVDGNYINVLDELRQLKAGSSRLKIIVMPRSFGDASAITVAFEASKGTHILTLPAYRHIVASDISKLIAQMDSYDVVVANRYPRTDGRLNQIQSKLFTSVFNSISGLQLSDAGCSVRLLRRQVLEEVQLYGDFHRFVSMLATRQGFTVGEVPVRQAEEESQLRIYRPGIYLRRMLDLLSAYFLLRFTKKPFRFFGLIGAGVLLVGAGTSAWVVVERLYGGTALADRPALLLGSLLMVFGIQIISVGLIGEIIIFTHAREMKEFNVKRVIE